MEGKIRSGREGIADDPHVRLPWPDRIRVVDRDGKDLEPDFGESFSKGRILGVRDGYAIAAAEPRMSRSAPMRVASGFHFASYLWNENGLGLEDARSLIRRLQECARISLEDRDDLARLLDWCGQADADISLIMAQAIRIARASRHWIGAIKEEGGLPALDPCHAPREFDASKHRGVAWITPDRYRGKFGGDPKEAEASMNRFFASIADFEAGKWAFNVLFAVPAARIGEAAWQARDGRRWMQISTSFPDSHLEWRLGLLDGRYMEIDMQLWGVGAFDCRLRSDSVHGERARRTMITHSFRDCRKGAPGRMREYAGSGTPWELTISGPEETVSMRAMDDECGNLDWAIHCATGYPWHDCDLIRCDIADALRATDTADLESGGWKAHAAAGNAVKGMESKSMPLAGSMGKGMRRYDPARCWDALRSGCRLPRRCIPDREYRPLPTLFPLAS